jgi:hypothetical protein
MFPLVGHPQPANKRASSGAFLGVHHSCIMTPRSIGCRQPHRSSATLCVHNGWSCCTFTAKEAPHGDLQKSVGRGDHGEDETHLPLQAMDHKRKITCLLRQLNCASAKRASIKSCDVHLQPPPILSSRSLTAAVCKFPCASGK